MIKSGTPALPNQQNVGLVRPSAPVNAIQAWQNSYQPFDYTKWNPTSSNSNWTSDTQKQLQDYIESERNKWLNNGSQAQSNLHNGSQGAADFAAQFHLSDKMLSNIKNIAPSLLDKMQKGDLGSDWLDTAKKAIGGDPIALEKINEQYSAQQQLQQQNQKLSDYRGQLEQQEFGGQGLSLSQALTSTGGDIGNLNSFLGQQEADTFNTQLKPLIQMSLGAQGLSDSGAQVELQSKALAQLEQQRQASMMQAALGARSQIQGLQRQDVLGDVGATQTMMNNQFDLNRSNITMQYQMQLEAQREQLAKDLAGKQGGQSALGLIGMGGGAVIGGALGAIGGPQTALMGAGLGASLGGAVGGYFGSQNGSNTQYGQSAVPGAFFSAGQMVGPARQNTAYQMPQGYQGGWQTQAQTQYGANV